MYTGQCLCGGATYQVNEEISEVECCHCLTCQKAHSSAFAMGVTISSEAFHLKSGQHLLKEYESSEGKRRVFCGNCGSHLYAFRINDPEVIRLRPACLNTDLKVFNLSHIHTENSICQI